MICALFGSILFLVYAHIFENSTKLSVGLILLSTVLYWVSDYQYYKLKERITELEQRKGGAE